MLVILKAGLIHSQPWQGISRVMLQSQKMQVWAGKGRCAQPLYCPILTQKFYSVIERSSFQVLSVS